jgi:hypothetical protein
VDCRIGVCVDCRMGSPWANARWPGKDGAAEADRTRLVWCPGRQAGVGLSGCSSTPNSPCLSPSARPSPSPSPSPHQTSPLPALSPGSSISPSRSQASHPAILPRRPLTLDASILPLAQCSHPPCRRSPPLLTPMPSEADPAPSPCNGTPPIARLHRRHQVDLETGPNCME